MEYETQKILTLADIIESNSRLTGLNKLMKYLYEYNKQPLEVRDYENPNIQNGLSPVCDIKYFLSGEAKNFCFAELSWFPNYHIKFLSGRLKRLHRFTLICYDYFDDVFSLCLHFLQKNESEFVLKYSYNGVFRFCKIKRDIAEEILGIVFKRDFRGPPKVLSTFPTSFWFIKNIDLKSEFFNSELTAFLQLGSSSMLNFFEFKALFKELVLFHKFINCHQGYHVLFPFAPSLKIERDFTTNLSLVTRIYLYLKIIISYFKCCNSDLFKILFQKFHKNVKIQMYIRDVINSFCCFTKRSCLDGYNHTECGFCSMLSINHVKNYILKSKNSCSVKPDKTSSHFDAVLFSNVATEADEYKTDQKDDTFNNIKKARYSEVLNSLQISTGKEEIEEIDGVSFITFETESDILEFTNLEKNCLKKINNNNKASLHNHNSSGRIIPTKTHDITKIKGWKNKIFFTGLNNGFKTGKGCLLKSSHSKNALRKVKLTEKKKRTVGDKCENIRLDDCKISNDIFLTNSKQYGRDILSSSLEEESSDKSDESIVTNKCFRKDRSLDASKLKQANEFNTESNSDSSDTPKKENLEYLPENITDLHKRNLGNTKGILGIKSRKKSLLPQNKLILYRPERSVRKDELWLDDLDFEYDSNSDDSCDYKSKDLSNLEDIKDNEELSLVEDGDEKILKYEDASKLFDSHLDYSLQRPDLPINHKYEIKKEEKIIDDDLSIQYKSHVMNKIPLVFVCSAENDDHSNCYMDKKFNNLRLGMILNIGYNRPFHKEVAENVELLKKDSVIVDNCWATIAASAVNSRQNIKNTIKRILVPVVSKSLLNFTETPVGDTSTNSFIHSVCKNRNQLKGEYINTEVRKVVYDLVEYVVKRERFKRLNIPYDPDIPSTTTYIKTPLKKYKKSKVERELNRLVNVTLVDECHQIYNYKNAGECGNGYCIKGCICQSLNGRPPALHCGKEKCMFKCRCQNIDNEYPVNCGNTNFLAKEESTWHQTVVCKNNEVIEIHGEAGKSKREKKLPTRFRDSVLLGKEMSSFDLSQSSIINWRHPHLPYKTFLSKQLPKTTPKRVSSRNKIVTNNNEIQKKSNINESADDLDTQNQEAENKNKVEHCGKLQKKPNANESVEHLVTQSHETKNKNKTEHSGKIQKKTKTNESPEHLASQNHETEKHKLEHSGKIQKKTNTNESAENSVTDNHEIGNKNKAEHSGKIQKKLDTNESTKNLVTQNHEIENKNKVVPSGKIKKNPNANESFEKLVTQNHEIEYKTENSGTDKSIKPTTTKSNTNPIKNFSVSKSPQENSKTLNTNILKPISNQLQFHFKDRPDSIHNDIYVWCTIHYCYTCPCSAFVFLLKCNLVVWKARQSHMTVFDMAKLMYKDSHISLVHFFNRYNHSARTFGSIIDYCKRNRSSTFKRKRAYEIDNSILSFSNSFMKIELPPKHCPSDEFKGDISDKYTEIISIDDNDETLSNHSTDGDNNDKSEISNCHDSSRTSSFNTGNHGKFLVGALSKRDIIDLNIIKTKPISKDNAINNSVNLGVSSQSQSSFITINTKKSLLTDMSSNSSGVFRPIRPKYESDSGKVNTLQSNATGHEPWRLKPKAPKVKKKYRIGPAHFNSVGNFRTIITKNCFTKKHDPPVTEIEDVSPNDCVIIGSSEPSSLPKYGLLCLTKGFGYLPVKDFSSLKITVQDPLSDNIYHTFKNLEEANKWLNLFFKSRILFEDLELSLKWVIVKTGILKQAKPFNKALLENNQKMVNRHGFLVDRVTRDGIIVEKVIGSSRCIATVDKQDAMSRNLGRIRTNVGNIEQPLKKIRMDSSLPLDNRITLTPERNKFAQMNRSIGILPQKGNSNNSFLSITGNSVSNLSKGCFIPLMPSSLKPEK